MFLENMHRRKVVKMIFMLENTNWNKTLSLKDAPPWILMNVGDIYAWYFSIEEFDDASAEQHGCIYRSSLNPTENSAGEFLKRRKECTNFYQAMLFSYWEQLSAFLM